MKKINEYVLIANDEKEYDDFNNNQIHDHFDIMCLFEVCNGKSFKNLHDFIVNKIEIFDRYNAVIDFKKIKYNLGIKENFAEYPKGMKLQSFDKDSIKLNTNAISKSPTEMDFMCQIIFAKVYDGFLTLLGPISM